MEMEKVFRKLLLRLDGWIVENNSDHKRLMAMAKANGLSAAALASKEFLDICEVLIKQGKLSKENLNFLKEVFPEQENISAFRDICETGDILSGAYGNVAHYAEEASDSRTNPSGSKTTVTEGIVNIPGVLNAELHVHGGVVNTEAFPVTGSKGKLVADELEISGANTRISGEVHAKKITISKANVNIF